MPTPIKKFLEHVKPMVSQNLENVRRNYLSQPLQKSTLQKDPIKQLEIWMTQVQETSILDPTSASLATASKNGFPTNRIVLIKEVTTKGLIFYTNYNSQKALQLKENPKACLLFYWDMLHRQVRINGTVSKISSQKSETYFQSRPFESQIMASISSQSAPLYSKETINSQFEQIHKTKTNPLPLPKHWGGYILTPHYFEFWQGQSNRNHDRFAYSQKNSTWSLQRLAP